MWKWWLASRRSPCAWGPALPSLVGTDCSGWAVAGLQLWGCRQGCPLTQLCFSSGSFNAPKCGRGKPALVRRHTLEDRSELISCIENGNYAKAARIAAGECLLGPPFCVLWLGLPEGSTSGHGCPHGHHIILPPRGTWWVCLGLPPGKGQLQGMGGRLVCWAVHRPAGWVCAATPGRPWRRSDDFVRQLVRCRVLSSKWFLG